MNVQKLFFDYGWEEAINILVGEYSIKVKEYGDFFVLDYDQINSPKTDKHVIECRGLTIDKQGKILARAFPRFFNWGEAPETTVGFDFSRANVLEKADGSLIKVYFNPHTDKWEIATRGTAFAEGPHDFYGTFRNAVLVTLGVTEQQFQIDCAKLEKGFTYIMEYIGPSNRIVTRYTKDELVYIDKVKN